MSRSILVGAAEVAVEGRVVLHLAAIAAILLSIPSVRAQNRYSPFNELQLPGTIVSNTISSVVADFNSDGNLDMVLGSSLSKVILILGDGRGGFRQDAKLQMPAPETTGSIWPSYASVHAGDVDGDGDLDLAIGTIAWTNLNLTGYSDRLFLGDGKGNFVDGTKGRLPQSKDITSEVKFVDVDRDGDLDLLCAGAFGTSRIYINDGKGVFKDETSTRFPKSMALMSASNFAVGDLDGDGDEDLVVSDGGFWALVSQANLALRNNGKGYFSLLPVPFMKLQTGCVALGDMDGDGDLDIVTANWGLDGLYLNDGKGRFVNATATHMPQEKSNTAFWLHDWVGLDDVDGDGDLDMIFSGYFKQWLVFYPNDGKGRFTAASREGIEWQGGGWSARLADLDRDGDRDLYTGYVFYNLQKQLYLSPKDLVRGKTSSYEIHAARGPRVILPYIALKESRIPLLPWGTFFLDPMAMIPMGTVLLMKGGKQTLPLTIPNDPRLGGKTVYLQAVVFDLHKARFLGLTNETANRIR